MLCTTRVYRHAAPSDQVQRDLEHLLGRALRPMGGAGLEPAAFTSHAVDVREDNDHLTVEAELPGFRKEELDITLENNVLTITAEKAEEARATAVAAPTDGEATAPARPGPEYLLKERRYRRFARSFTLPRTVDGSAVDARLEHGILTVTLNKRQESKPRKIAVA